MKRNPSLGSQADGARAVTLKKAANLLGCFILTFCICWAPYGGYYLWVVYGPPDGLKNGANSDCASQIESVKWRSIVVLFIVMNDAADPLIYMLGVKDIKDSVKETIKKKLNL